MATRSQQHKSQAEREAAGTRPKAPRRITKKSHTVDTSLPGVSATDKKRGKGATAKRNVSMHAAKKASVVLEDSAQERPSRKSTRKAANAIKADSNLRAKATRATRSPKARAAKAAARTK